VAAALASSAADDPLALTLGAGSFSDGTRVAATRPELIAAMCGGNAKAVGVALDEVLASRAVARTALDDPEPLAALHPWLARGHAARSTWPPPASATVDLPAHADTLLRLGQVGGWVTAVAADRRTVTAARPVPVH
jgi:prephenate dehydrogenase